MAKTKEITIGEQKFTLQSVSPSWYYDFNDECGNTGSGKRKSAKYMDGMFKNCVVAPAEVKANGMEYFDDNGRTGQEKLLFDEMRKGAKPFTSLLPTAAYLEYFEPVIREKNLLFIAFSSQMSATIANVFEAREELLSKYPERKFIVVGGGK